MFFRIPSCKTSIQIGEELSGMGAFEAAPSGMVCATHAGHWNSGVARTLLTHLVGFVVAAMVVAYNLIK